MGVSTAVRGGWRGGEVRIWLMQCMRAATIRPPHVTKESPSRLNLEPRQLRSDPVGLRQYRCTVPSDMHAFRIRITNVDKPGEVRRPHLRCIHVSPGKLIAGPVIYVADITSSPTSPYPPSTVERASRLRSLNLDTCCKRRSTGRLELI